MRRTLLFFFLISFSFNIYAANTETQYLSGIDKDSTVTWDFFCTKGMNSGKWSTIEVPSQWEQQGFGAYNYGMGDKFNDEQGLYKYTFTVPRRWDSKKVFIVFEGSMTDTEVTINGKSAGAKHQGAFYQFKYDITNLLEYGKPNLLEVTVNKESSDSSVNEAERRSDYWVFGGIFRPVYLEALPEIHIRRVAINAKADGSFNLDVFLSGITNSSLVEAQIYSSDGKPFGELLTLDLKKNSEKARLSRFFKEPLLWSTETPNLYHVVVTLKDKKNTIHQIKQRFGFRTVEVKQKDGIYVNNKKILFKGVCRHTFWPESGRTSSKKLSIADVNLMKDMNMNAVRMSHYPPDQHFLDVCDSLGLFVLDELAGWQAYYNTEVGKRLVKQMVERDVNHPSIVIWDNGNEGGFNKELRAEYAKYDIQNRKVIEPWAKLNGMDTKHYPGYKYVKNALENGDHIFFPTEFLHGLFDGGHGAGLDDYWNFMVSKPLSAGGFLWVFADEGIVRKDKKDSIDNHGNNAPDGILGPFHEKEGSYYTIKEIWSPVVIDKLISNPVFDGKAELTNRYSFTNLNQCKFKFELVRLNGEFPITNIQSKTYDLVSPDIPPGEKGVLNFDLPENIMIYDVFYLTATDPNGKEIYTWSWNITDNDKMATRILKKSVMSVSAMETEKTIVLNSDITTVTFDKTTGLLKEVLQGDKLIPFNNGPQFLGDTMILDDIKQYISEKNHVIEITYKNAPGCYVKWTMLKGGSLMLEYQYNPVGNHDYAGITFNYPENRVIGATLMANGPYRVWKNRLKGVEFGVFEKNYNRTVTGQTWNYPEFKGYYSNFYAVEIKTKELPFTIISATPGLYLHLFTPDAPTHIKGSVNPPFPKGNISILNGICAIGTKFSTPEFEGPQGQKNEYLPDASLISCKLFFKFGE